MKSAIDETGSAGIRLLITRICIRINQYARTGLTNPSWFIMFIFGRFTIIRRASERFRPQRSASLIEKGKTIFLNINAGSAVASLHDEGIFLGLHLLPNVVEGILKFAEAATCYANADKERPFRVDRQGSADQGVGRRLIGDYRDEINRCPEIMDLRHDATLAHIAERYLGSPPHLTRTRLWWSFVEPEANSRELTTFSQNSFHFDIDDWKCLKFFFYLTEVDEGSGPHQFIRYSHRLRKLRHQFTLFKGQSLQSLRKAYPEHDFLTITGPAGFGFAEDPFGFHTGTSASTKPRLMLEIEFGVTRLPVAGRYGSPTT